MKRYLRSTPVLMLFPLIGFGAVRAADVELRGSPGSMQRQHEVATINEYAFVKTGDDIEEAVRKGEVVPVEGNEDYWVKTKRYRYARPEVKLFIERLAAQYHEATGERLVVTSLMRPKSEQPSNSHPLSVHPAGMAVDLRVPRNEASLSWLQNTLLSLEGKGVLDVTREYRPPHFHVAVYPKEYAAYAAERMAEEEEAARVAARRAEADEAAGETVGYAEADAGEGQGTGRAVAAVFLMLSGAAAWRGLRLMSGQYRQGGVRRNGGLS